MSPARSRLLRVGLAGVVFILASEAGLQVLAFHARASLGERLARPGSSDAITILCLGDSHTYGAAVAESESYPSQLAVLLERHYAPLPVRVINGGFPGVNSAFVANRLEQNLLQLRPHLVIIWVGTNNGWNSLETDAWQRRSLGERLDHLLLHSKLYRLAKVLRVHRPMGDAARAARVSAADAPAQGGGMVHVRREQPLSDAELDAGIAHDLERMAEVARAVSVPLLVVSYPLAEMSSTNRALATHARRLDLPLIETAIDYARARRDGHPHDALIVNASGPHPTGLLYGYAAESMLPIVVAELSADHGIDAPRAAGPGRGPAPSG